MTNLVTLNGSSRGMQIGFKTVSGGNTDDSTAGQFHLQPQALNGAIVSDLAQWNSTDRQEIVLRYVKSENMAYVSVTNVRTMVTWLTGTKPSVWYTAGTVAHFRNFFGTCTIHSVLITTA